MNIRKTITSEIEWNTIKKAQADGKLQELLLEVTDATRKQKEAEIHALEAQINPHFLFNALESIRMHSILKKEEETADMIQKLAIMVRQNVDWSSDSNTIKRELAFVEAYLSLQKYRFGERLSYQINAQEDCQNILVPKLTITTFVENACVHGLSLIYISEPTRRS